MIACILSELVHCAFCEGMNFIPKRVVYINSHAYLKYLCGLLYYSSSEN